VVADHEDFAIGHVNVFTLKFENPTSHSLDRVRLSIRPDSHASGTGSIRADCFDINHGGLNGGPWRFVSDSAPPPGHYRDPHGGEWEAWVGPLAPGQSVETRFCLSYEVGYRPATEMPCVIGERFVAATAPGAPTPFVAEAYTLNRRRDCALCDPLSSEAACCAVEAIYCVLHPGDALLCGGAPTAPQSFSELWGSVKDAAARFLSTVSDLPVLYLLRDNVLAATPGGRRAVELYEAHQAELRRLLVGNPALRERTVDVLTAWRPLLSVLVARQGATARVTAEQVAALEGLLSALDAVGSPQLRMTIARERAGLEIASIVGLDADRALQRLNRLSCAPGATTLCLDGGRFRVDAEWQTSPESSGSAHAVALTPDTGYFWFFAPNNVEMVVKVLEACSYNQRRWVFAGGLSNVHIVLNVTDTRSGAVKTYVNPQGEPFQPIQDTIAFVCE
jgi:hypothetical protein